MKGKENTEENTERIDKSVCAGSGGSHTKTRIEISTAALPRGHTDS